MRRDDLLTEEDFRALVEAASHQCKKCRILDGELSLTRIRRAAGKMKARTGLDLLILDYDELIEAEGRTEFEQRRYQNVTSRWKPDHSPKTRRAPSSRKRKGSIA